MAKLEMVGFVKKEINKSKYKTIENLFILKEEESTMMTKCKLPIYRDILIFKKNNMVICVAKICFGCHKNLIIGRQVNSINFGEYRDYEKLSKLLP
jgi:hypothetical protein